MTAGSIRLRRRRWMIMLTVAVALAVLVLVLTSRTGTRQAVSVTVEEIGSGGIRKTLNVTATVQAAGTQKVLSAGFPVAEIMVANGDRVSAGTPLLRYDLSDLQASYDESVRLREETEAMVAEMEEEISGMSAELDGLDPEALTGLDMDYAGELSQLSGQFGQLAAQMGQFSSIGNLASGLDSGMLDSLNEMLDGINRLVASFEAIQGSLEELAADWDAEMQKLRDWLQQNGQGSLPVPTLPGELPGNLPTLPTTEPQPSETTAPTTEGTGEPRPGDETSTAAEPQTRWSTGLPVLRLSLGGLGSLGSLDTTTDPAELIEQISSQYESAGQLLTQAKQSEAEAKRLLDSTDELVRAEFDGFVYGVSVEPGEAGLSQQPLLTVYDDSALQAVFRANSFDMVDLREGQAVTFFYNADTMYGHVEEVAPLASPPDVGSFSLSGESEAAVPVTLAITDGETDKLVVGFDIDCEILVDERTGALVMPLEAVYQDEDESYYAWVLDGQDIVRKRPVTLGLESHFEVEVLSGAAAGDLVVVSADGDLSDGQQVIAGNSRPGQQRP